MKKDYEAPALTVLGTIADLTLAGMPGDNPDLQLQSPNLGSIVG